MKQTKRLIATLLVLTVAIFALCACQLPEEPCQHTFENGVCTLCGEQEYVNVTIVLANGHDDTNKKVYNVNTADYNVSSQNSVYDLLDAINNAKGELHLFDIVVNGTWMSAIDSLVGSNEDRTYVAVYSSVLADKDPSAFADTQPVNGVDVYTTTVGIKEMHLEEGATLYFVLLSW